MIDHIGNKNPFNMRKSPFKRKTKKLSKLPKQKSVSKLKKDLWVVFSKYIRQRDKYTCVTCGKKGEGSGIHAGHYITMSVGGLGLYFHEKNVHAQCYRCNIHLSGNWTAYREFILKQYGQEVDTKLLNMKSQIVKLSEQDYIEKIAHYKGLLTE